ncbi:PIN domain-containing protein [Candidatus Woesearchaeota archaeon]|nr:PIN domain-containing protein [Candidatus Woesearchaeota archaeon]
MASNYALDSSVWLAFFTGSPKAAAVKELLKGSTIVASTMAIAEIADKAIREGFDAEMAIAYVEDHAEVEPVTSAIAVLAAELKHKHRRKDNRFGIVDAIHLATARLRGAILLTLDTDFSGIADARVL